jgi:HK97 family phage major capsid protein/HK97 family phage prohead protease
MPRAHTTEFSGHLLEISAAEDANLAERELPTPDGKTRTVAGIPKKLGRQFRKVKLDGYDADAHTVTMAVSSSEPVDRYYGREILSHDKGALRGARLKGGVSLLFNHDMDALLGRTQSFEQGDPVRVTARFGTSDLAQQMEKEVAARILTDVSIGYQVLEWEITEDKNGVRTYTATDWEIYEVSLVTVPADPTVGVGRDAQPVKVRSFRSEMDDDEEEDGDGSKTGDEEDDDDESDERSQTSATSRNTNSTEQRTATMDPKETHAAAATAGVDQVVQERKRVATLQNYRTINPEQYSEAQLRADVDSGADPNTVGNAIAERVIAAHSRTNVPTLGDEVAQRMSDKEKRQYSLRNVYAAAVNLRFPGTIKDKAAEAGFEREVGAELVKLAEERGITGLGAGIPIPSATTRALFGIGPAQTRAVTAGGNFGGVADFTEVEPTAIELLRSKVVCMALGARMLSGLKGTIKMPRQSGAATSNWEAESGAVSDSDLTLDSIQMSPHRLSMQNQYTLELLAQSAVAVDPLLAEDRQQVLARALDFAGINGPGSGNSPLGLLLQSGLSFVLTGAQRSSAGVVTPGVGGLPPTYIDLNDMEGLISTANGDIGTMGWAFRPKMRAVMRSIPQLPGSAVSGFIMPNSKVGPNGVQEGPLGYNCIASTQIPTGYTANSVSGLDAMILGVWSQMLFGDWGLSEVIVDPYTQAAAGTYVITEHGLYDTNVRHVPSFAATTSALAS